MPVNTSSSSVPVVFHCNVNGIGPRVEELRRASAGASVISLQDTRLRDERDAADFFRREWPGYSAYTIVHNDAGLGCSLLVKATVPHRLTARRSGSRHRLLIAEVRLPDGLLCTVASLHVPPLNARNGVLLRSDLVEMGLSGRKALLVGDLNARSADLGCRSTNLNGDVLFDIIDHLEVVVLNDPRAATIQHVSHSYEDCLDWALSTPALAPVLACMTGSDV